MMRVAPRVVWFAALCVLVPACCADGSPLLEIWATPASGPSDSACDWRPITWNGTNPLVPGTHLLVVYDEGDDEDGLVHTALELRDGTGASVPMAKHRDDEAACSSGCPSPRVHYTLPSAGTFTLVHRKRTGSGKEVWTPGNATDPWTTFEGERALVATLVIGAP